MQGVPDTVEGGNVGVQEDAASKVTQQKGVFHLCVTSKVPLEPPQLTHSKWPILKGQSDFHAVRSNVLEAKRVDNGRPSVRPENPQAQHKPRQSPALRQCSMQGWRRTPSKLRRCSFRCHGRPTPSSILRPHLPTPFPSLQPTSNESLQFSDTPDSSFSSILKLRLGENVQKSYT